MISSGWATFKKNWKFIILAGLATVLVMIIVNMIQRGLKEHIIVMLIATVVLMLVEFIITLGWVKVMVSLNRTGTASWATFETKPKTWLSMIKLLVWLYLYIFYYVLIVVLPFGIVAIIGLLVHMQMIAIIAGIVAYVAFIVAAIYTGIKYQFMFYVLLDHPELRSRAIFRKAGELTKGNKLQLLGFGIVLFFYNILGLICLVVGLVVTIPVSKLAHAKVYDFLKEKHTHTEPAHEVSHQN
jgi:hypothetical protein